MTAPTPDVEAAMERVAEMVADLKGDPASLAWPYKLTVPESLTCKAVVADLTLILALAREAAGLRERLCRWERANLSGAWVSVDPHMRWAQVQRLRFVGHLVETVGRVNRSDLMEKFSISMPQASTDLNAFLRLNPGILTYDTTAKCYRRALTPAEKEGA